MSIYDNYELVDLIHDDGIKTFQATERATGRQVLVHLFTQSHSPEMQALLKKVANLPPESRAQIITQGDHEGTQYVITGPITAYPGFREWLLAQRATGGGAQSPAAAPPRDAGTAPDDPFASLFKKPEPAKPGAQRAMPKAATEDFRHLIETPTHRAHAVRLDAGAPEEKTRLYGTPPPMAPPPARAADSGAEAPHQGSQFTRLFDAPAAPPPVESHAADSEGGGFTKLFDAPQKPVEPPPQAASTPEGPGEFTRMFQASSAQPPAAPSAPASGKKTSAAPPASGLTGGGEFTRLFDPPPTPVAAPPPSAPLSTPQAPAETAGEFTQQFQSGPAAAPAPVTMPKSAPLPQPAAAPETAGEFTRMFQTAPAQVVGTGAPSKPPVEPAEIGRQAKAPAPPAPVEADSFAAQSPKQEPGEFTKFFQTAPAMTPPATPVPKAPPAAPQQSGHGEFTRMFQTTPAAAAQSPAEAPKPPAGEFTRLFQAGSGTTPPPPAPFAASAGTERYSASMPAKPPATPPGPPPASPPPPAEAPGEFTKFFSSAGTAMPQSQPPSQAPAPPPAGEFTRMFQGPSPASPRGQGAGEATDRFGNAASAPPSQGFGMSPAQAFPMSTAQPAGGNEPGEFTKMFESPLHPAPLKPTQGPADPYAGRPASGAPQAAPVGEFTALFGAREMPPQTPVIGTPTPKPASAGSATAAFQAPQFDAGFAPSQGGGFASSGPAPSLGRGDYTGIISAPTSSLLAEAAAAQPQEAKQSFFKKYLPLILVGVGLLLIFIIILVVFASKRH